MIIPDPENLIHGGRFKHKAPGGFSNDGTTWVIVDRRLFLQWREKTAHLPLEEALKVTDPDTYHLPYGYKRDGVTTITDMAKYQEHLDAIKDREEQQKERQRIERQRIEMEEAEVRRLLAERGVVLQFEQDYEDTYMTILIDGVMVAKDIPTW